MGLVRQHRSDHRHTSSAALSDTIAVNWWQEFAQNSRCTLSTLHKKVRVLTSDPDGKP